MMTAKERQEQWRETGFDPHGFWKAVEQSRQARGKPWRCWFKAKRKAHESVEKRRKG